MMYHISIYLHIYFLVASPRFEFDGVHPIMLIFTILQFIGLVFQAFIDQLILINKKLSLSISKFHLTYENYLVQRFLTYLLLQ
jgi:hypothetical protein